MNTACARPLFTLLLVTVVFCAACGRDAGENVLDATHRAGLAKAQKECADYFLTGPVPTEIAATLAAHPQAVAKAFAAPDTQGVRAVDFPEGSRAWLQLEGNMGVFRFLTRDKLVYRQRQLVHGTRQEGVTHYEKSVNMTVTSTIMWGDRRIEDKEIADFFRYHSGSSDNNSLSYTCLSPDAYYSYRENHNQNGIALGAPSEVFVSSRRSGHQLAVVVRLAADETYRAWVDYDGKKSTYEDLVSVDAFLGSGRFLSLVDAEKGPIPAVQPFFALPMTLSVDSRETDLHLNSP